jgi:hypothetical protein
MRTTYRFLKTHRTCTFFGAVQISTDEKTEEANVTVKLFEPLRPGDGEVSPAFYGDWFKAAIIGAQKALNEFQKRSPDSPLPNIFIEKVIGTEVDTSADVIECASGMATWQALSTGLPDPEIIYQDGWKLKFTA